MATQWLRRALLLAASASALLLAACGGGSVESQLAPARVIAFGDAMGDVGQNGRRYTVNDGSVNNWTQFVAQSYGRTITSASAGGTSYATGNARVTVKPDAAGNTATLTVTEQVTAFLASGKPDANDLVLVSAGTSDVIAEAQAVIAGTQSRDQMLVNLGNAGRELGAQVRRLVAAGATHVVVVGPFNLGRTPWALETNQADLLTAASGRFDDQLLVSMVDLGTNVLYVDAQLYFNLVVANYTSGAYNLSDVTHKACTSVDPGPGIGTGAGQVNSNLCTPATVLPGIDYSRYLYADRVYITPRAHQLFGDYAYGRIKERF
ncbi:MAG: family lipase [Ramlibacter sp.]|jgi:outer membrane lipase/esterase|nr:family lipase [Ramlibacter sp.]MDB5911488.1 family lipase [Ramlibacter sp.]